MKKLSLSLIVLFLLPAVSSAERIRKRVVNAYTWSHAITSSNDTAWQVHNPTTTTGTKTIYIGPVDVATDKGGYFTVYSTNVGTGFTGSTSAGSISTSLVGSGTTSISSTTFSSNASSPTGDVVWQGVVVASDTVRLITEQNPWALRPGQALYILKSNGGANDKSAASFYFREEPR